STLFPWSYCCRHSTHPVPTLNLLYVGFFCASSFFFTCYPPPRDLHLFPYTTLFRSVGFSCGTMSPDRKRDDVRGYVIAFLPSYRDRKSTRLNSSHSQISYAVFCLKKKKITITEMSAGYPC